MTQVVESTTMTAPPDLPDLATALRHVLRHSDEPLTVSKLRAKLPARLKDQDLEEELRRQVAAGTLYQFPKYRSTQDRFWDRQMPEHIKLLIRQALQETGPLAWSELRRKLPAYALDRAEAVFQEEIVHGRLHRHPRQGRGSDRFGLEKPDPKEYLRSELIALFSKLRPLGFSPDQLRAGALELLHDEEWQSLPQASPAPTLLEPPVATLPAPTALPAPALAGTPGQPT